MNAPIPTISFELNGRAVNALPHETLIEVAAREGIEVPRLCYKEGMEAVGNCRSCMVEIDGERVLAPCKWLKGASTMVCPRCRCTSYYRVEPAPAA